MEKVDLQKLVFTKVARVSRTQFDNNPAQFAAMVGNEMREALAHHIQTAKVETRFGDHHVEGRLELYVASPDEFWAVVNRVADDIVMRYGMTIRPQPVRPTPSECSVLESQLVDWMEGVGANEDGRDILRALTSMGVSPAVAKRMQAALLPKVTSPAS